MAVYTVKPGDNLTKIAKQHGIKTWQELYNHRDNGDFRKLRGNPDLIFPGDKINIPGSGGPGSGGILPVPQLNPRLGKFARHEEAMRKELQKVQPQQIPFDWEEFRKFLEETMADWSTAFSIGERVEDAVKVVNFYKGLKALGLPLSEMKAVVPILLQVKEPDKFVAALIAPGTKTAAAFKTLSKAGTVVGAIMLIAQMSIHVIRSDYAAAFAEAYRFGLGKILPWLGLVDGVESLVSAFHKAPEGKKDDRFWRYVKILNVVSLNAASVDVVGTMFQMMITKDMDPKRMDRLIERLRNSPLQVFLEIGEDLDKALSFFEQMPEAEFQQAMSAQNFLNWIKYEITGKLP